MNIPYVDVAAQHGPLKEELLEAVGRVIDHGQFVFGEEVGEFEEQFAEFCGARFAVGVNSGTDALVLALRVLGIGPGDEVITVPNSFIASTGCIAVTGARPVFVDVRDDYNIDPARIEEAVTAKTRAILPVHLTGRPAEMGVINEIAEAHRLQVVEDCAQAVMAEYEGRRAGSLGTFGCFSFHPLKTLNACGDAGVVTTDTEESCEKIRALRHLGLRARDDCAVWSDNSRLDSIQAAVLLVKMKHVEEWVRRRRANSAFYLEALSGVPGLQLPAADRADLKSAWHTFVVQTDRRDELRAFLEGRGIGTAIHYPVPIHLHQAAKDLGYGVGSFPIAERQAKRILSLPSHQGLTEEQLTQVAEAVREFYGA